MATKVTKTTKSKSKKPEAREAGEIEVKTTKDKAVVEINSMQYLTGIGEVITIRVAEAATDNDLEVKLLALVGDNGIEYGKPYLDKKLEYSLGEVVKGDKVVSKTFKAKSRYRRKVGFRPKFRKFVLESIK